MPVIKLDEPVTPIPSESVELLESLEMILHQIQTEDVATTSTSLDEQAIKEDCMDDATALLDSLIKGETQARTSCVAQFGLPDYNFTFLVVQAMSRRVKFLTSWRNSALP